MGSSPASLVSCPADGSITSGRPKKSRTRGQAAGIVIGSPLVTGKAWPCHRSDRRGRPAFHEPPELGVDARRGVPLVLGAPMNDVTRILSAIEEGDPHA